MNNYITLYGEPLEYPHQVSVDKRGVAYYVFRRPGLLLQSEEN